VEAIVQHYKAVQQSNEPLQPITAAARDKRSDSGEKYYSNGTPAERYWTSMGGENNSKRQNVSSLLQMIFPDGLAPLANKVAKIERKEQAKAARQAAKQAAALAAVTHAEAAAEAAAMDTATDHATGISATRSSGAGSAGMGVGGSSPMAEQLSKQSSARAEAIQRGGSVMQGASSPVSGGRSPMPQAESVSASESQARTAGTASSSRHAEDSRRTTDAISAVFEDRKPRHKHYSHGQKLAASILWEAASGKSQPVRLRQCLTYSEICMKNLACAELAQLPVGRLDLQEPAYRVAQEV